MIASIIQTIFALDTLLFVCGLKSITGWICDKIGV